MFSSQSNLKAVIGVFHLNRMLRYSVFVPRLYNLYKALGFEAGKVMHSRAFCADESRCYPITRHFGTFAFNHVMVGGIFATDCQGPPAENTARTW